MKFLLPTLLLLFSPTIFGQTAPDIEGSLVDSGPLVFKDKVVGHYRVTDNRQISEETYVYTITLLGNDLQPLGNKVYRAENPLDFERVSYNGTYLGVMFKGTEKDGKRFVDLIDSSGERVRRIEVRTHAYSSGLFLVPTNLGFVAAVAGVNWDEVVWDLELISTKEEVDGWKETFNFRATNGVTIPQLLDVDENRILLGIKKSKKRQLAHYRDVYCIELTTGDVLFKNEQEKKVTAARTEDFMAGGLVEDHSLVVQRIPKSAKTKNKTGFTVKLFDAAGKVETSRTFYHDALFVKALKTAGIAFPQGEYRPQLTGVRVSQSGNLVMAYEPVYEYKAKRLIGYEYQEAYVIVLNPDFSPGPVHVVDKKRFQLSLRDASGVESNEVARLRKRMRKGQFDKLNMEELVTLHSGPYGLAMMTNGPDFTTSFFLDREFTSDDVVYHGIKVVTFIDGEFETDYIPLEDAYDFVEIGRAREGYLKLTAYEYGKGAVRTWLERLNF